jgi:DNA-binding transcriptional MerR regulator
MSSPVPSRSYMTIGEVLANLRPEFPDVTISKIRFLEAAGLVEPARTPSGYRKFSAQDLDRLRYVLTAQRDHYLPLKVIKDHLDAFDRGAEPPALGAGARAYETRNARPRAVPPLEDPTPADFDRSAPQPRLSRDDLLVETGLDDAELRRLESWGLVTARPGGWFDADAAVIAATVAEMGRYGLEARHLRAFKSAADREVGLIEQVVTPLARQRSADARARAEEAVQGLAALSVRLHAALVRTGVRSTLP